MARSSAAVARASDSRCAATWPLALARRWRNAGGRGPLLAASENWLTALASARCSSAAWRSMPTGSRARSALPRATRRVSTSDRRASSSWRVACGRLERRHHPCTLARSSWALAISLSAIASGLTLNEPSASWAEIRATLSASNSPEAPPDSSVDAVLDRATVALASTVAAAGGVYAGRRLGGGLGRRGWRAGGGGRQRLVSGMSDLHGALQGAPAGPVPSSWTDYRPGPRRL